MQVVLLLRDSESEGDEGWVVKDISHRVVGGVFGPGTADTQSTMAARPLFNWSRVLGCQKAVPWPKEPQAPSDTW